MWVRGAAIRPIPSYAVVQARFLEAVERDLAEDENAQEELDMAFSRFESTQPHLASIITEVLGKPIDETALALGYFLSIAVWLSFERAFGNRLREVSEEDVKATEAALTLEEELRKNHAEQPIDWDDVVALEQPDVVAFMNEHIDAALDPATRDDDSRDVDVDDVHAIYRAVLMQTLALSHAVEPLDVTGVWRNHEMLA